MSKTNVMVDGVEYVRKDSIKIKKGAGPETKKQIVILQRGWVLVGDYAEKGEECTLADASVIRIWGTKKGLGQLALEGPLPDTKLDPCGTARFHKGAVIARLDIHSPEKWA